MLLTLPPIREANFQVGVAHWRRRAHVSSRRPCSYATPQSLLEELHQRPHLNCLDVKLEKQFCGS